jgi:VIT1/CCC1 family predicted Fe2+/Mn2+ transporter
MIFVTALATGLFTAMLRSAFAVIAVAFAIGLVFLTVSLISGAGIFALGMSVLGFNAGLLTVGAGYAVAAARNGN